MLKGPLIAGAIVLAASPAGGCSSSSNTPAPPAAAPACVFDLQFTGPIGGQFSATVTATCAVPMTMASTSLSIQQRPIGGSAMDWQNYDDPVESITLPPVTLAFKALCSPGQWQAVASIDAETADGAPINAQSESSTINVPTKADCTQ